MKMKLILRGFGWLLNNEFDLHVFPHDEIIHVEHVLNIIKLDQNTQVQDNYIFPFPSFTNSMSLLIS